MKWEIVITNPVKKQLKKLPEKIILLTQLLTHDLSMFGACPGRQWPNFGKLSLNSIIATLLKADQLMWHAGK
jgi:hypothetical protein